MNITWDGTSYFESGQRAFLNSGEFHYFRVPHDHWETRLRLLKEAGGNCVGTYIPWLIHEPSEGEILFGDVPERDLEGFLQLCARLDIAVICRPGPYQYSELNYSGLPIWLCEDYPQIRAHDKQGKHFSVSSISYLHPLFLEKVEKWFNAVCPLLAKYTAENGGPIAAVQIDNELTGIHLWFNEGGDYNAETMGFGKEQGRYPRFLESRYKSIGVLNDAYGEHFAAFKDVRPYDGEIKSDAARRRVKDYQDFYFATIGEYGLWLARQMRSHGIGCPIVHNSANPGMNAQFLELKDALSPEFPFLLGSDHYYNLNASWPQNNPTPQYAVKVFYSNEMLRLMGYPATVFELPGGSLSEWPPILVNDMAACYYTNTALGMKGHNYYIFTGGRNPFGSGGVEDIYDYSAGIGAQGEVRPLYYLQKEFGLFLKENKWLASSRAQSDFYLGLDWDQPRSESYSGQGQLFSQIDAWAFILWGIVPASFCANRMPELVDLSKPLPDPCEKPLIVSSGSAMAREMQEHIIEFIRAGGQAIIAPVIPAYDENFNPCTVLRDFLGCGETQAVPEGVRTVNIGPIHNVFSKKIFVTGLPEGAQPIAWEERRGLTLGFKKEYGKGSALYLGVLFHYGKNAQREALQFLLNTQGAAQPHVISDNPNVWHALRTDGEKTMLFAMNLHASPLTETVSVKTSEGYRELPAMTLNPMEVRKILL